jgi:hypothetical protein
MAVQTIASAGLIVFVSYAALAQKPEAKLTFDVASIKPSGPRSVRLSQGGPGSRSFADRVTLFTALRQQLVSCPA